MPEQVGNQISKTLLRSNTFVPYNKLCRTDFVFVNHRLFLWGCFAPPRLLRPGATAPPLLFSPQLRHCVIEDLLLQTGQIPEVSPDEDRRSQVVTPTTVLRYDTIRDAILTCAQKPTWASLIYRTEPIIKKWKTEKLKSKKGYAQKYW